MTQHGSRTGLKVLGQGRAYAAVIGVSAGMLTAGLAVPLAFGHLPQTSEASSSSTVDLGPGATAPGTTDQPGAVPGPGGTTLPSTGPVATVGPVVSGSRGPGGTTGGSPGSHVRLTATDQGVTATTVKVGVVLLDIRKLEPVGFSQPHFTPAEQQQRFQAFFDNVNKHGGLVGRMIRPVFVTWDALDSNGSHSAGAVCIQLAENEKVFAVMGFLGGNIAECLTETYHLPALADAGHIAEAYTKSHHLLVSPFPRLERGAANWGYIASQSGILNGRKIGTVSISIPDEARPEQALVDSLAAEGHPATYRAHFANDQATAQSQIPIEVNKMKAAGIDTVFLSTDFIMALQFAQTADKQGFKPQYVVSDIGSLQAEGLVHDMPNSYNGAILFTSGLNHAAPETPENTKCRKTFNANAGGQDWTSLKDEGGSLTLVCWMVKVFSTAADLVGPDLTRAKMGTAFQALTSITLPHTQPGSFGQGKTDWADYMRTARYATSCHCYQPAGGSQPGHYR